MTLQEINVGDPVKVDGEPGVWRVEGRTRKGELTLECLNVLDRIRLTDVHEFDVVKVGVFL